MKSSQEIDGLREAAMRVLKKITAYIGGDERRARRILIESFEDRRLIEALLPKWNRGRPQLDKNPAIPRLLLIYETKKSQEPEMTDTDFCRWYLELSGKAVNYFSIRNMRERLRRARKIHLSCK